MSARPQNIGVKAIEVYFPKQVRALNHQQSYLKREKSEEEKSVLTSYAVCRTNRAGEVRRCQ